MAVGNLFKAGLNYASGGGLDSLDELRARLARLTAQNRAMAPGAGGADTGVATDPMGQALAQQNQFVAPNQATDPMGQALAGQLAPPQAEEKPESTLLGRVTDELNMLAESDAGPSMAEQMLLTTRTNTTNPLANLGFGGRLTQRRRPIFDFPRGTVRRL